MLPALTQACALPSLTRLIATRIDESFFLRMASTGESDISTTSLACTIVKARFVANNLRNVCLHFIPVADEQQFEMRDVRAGPD